jgi:hypothetical protein
VQLGLHHGECVFERRQIPEQVLAGGASGEPALESVGLVIGQPPADRVGEFDGGGDP